MHVDLDTSSKICVSLSAADAGIITISTSKAIAAIRAGGAAHILYDVLIKAGVWGFYLIAHRPRQCQLRITGAFCC